MDQDRSRHGSVSHVAGLCSVIVPVLILAAGARAATVAGPPVLLYDGWTGDLSIATEGQPIDSLIVSSDSAMLLPQFAVFPQGTIDDAITPGQLTMSAGGGALSDVDFGPILPAALQARVIEADLHGLVRYSGQPAWDGIVVDLGNDQSIGGSTGGVTPEPAALGLLVTLALVKRRRKTQSA